MISFFFILNCFLALKVPGLDKYVPQWRISNLLLTLLLSFSKLNLNFLTIYLLIVLFLWWLYLSVNFFVVGISFYSFAYSFGLTLLMLFTILFLNYLTKGRSKISKVVSFLILAIFINSFYQFFEIISFWCGHAEIAKVLISDKVLQKSNFYRLVGGYYGASGLMGESGHLALWYGPLYMILYIFNRLGIYKVRNWVFVLMFISLFLTFSGGAFIELVFIILVMILLSRNKLKIFFLLLGVFILINYYFDFYIKFLFAKFDLFLSSDLSRLHGAKLFWEIFEQHPFWGIGIDSIRKIDADPNMLLPVFLTTYGFFGFIFMFLFLCVPVIFFLFFSKYKIFILPYIAMMLHLSLAYGTLTWSIIWINYSLILFGFYQGIRKGVLW